MSSSYVVIGGGVYGTATAWNLGQRGRDVTLLEADAVASGASGGPGKRGVRANGRDPRELPLVASAYDLWSDLSSEYDIGYERTGHLLLYERESGRLDGGYESAPARNRLQTGLGVETEVLDETAVRAREPRVSQNVVGALYCPNDGVVDHTKTTRQLADLAADAGAAVHEDTPVSGFEFDDDRVTTVVTERGRFDVDEQVVLLSNAHVPRIVERELGVDLPVWETYPQVVTTEPMDTVPVDHLIGHDHRRLALKELPGDRVMVSGGWSGEWDETRQRGTTVPERVSGNLEAAGAVFPDLADVRTEQADASRVETVSADGVPILSDLPGVDNLLVGTGWTGHGYAISLEVARLLARWAVEGDRPALLEPFDVRRFAPTDPNKYSSHMATWS
jgi:sarcosine oxidase subunit beta